MDCAAVFNCTLKRVPALLADILAFSRRSADEIDYFSLHQPNTYIFKNVERRLKLDES